MNVRNILTEVNGASLYIRILDRVYHMIYINRNWYQEICVLKSKAQ